MAYALLLISSFIIIIIIIIIIVIIISTILKFATAELYHGSMVGSSTV
jgi:hypothetical protein